MSGNGQVLWYATRGAGAVTLMLLTATVVLGLLTTAGVSGERTPRFLVNGLHRNVSLTALALLGVHIVTAVIDPFARLGITDAIIPFSSSYRRFWLALGVIAAEILVALVITSLVRRSLGRRSWRAVHWAAYACWPLGLLHGMGTGTDTQSWWMLAITAASVIAVLAAFIVRLRAGWPRLAVVRFVSGAAAAAGIVLLLMWSVTGPLRAGWARAAGTPADLLASANGSTGAAATPTPAPASLQAGLRDRLTGVLNADGSAQVVDSRDPSLRMTLTPDATGSTAHLVVTIGTTTVCDTRAALGDRITARCGSVAVLIELEVGEDDSALRGLLVTQPG